jgi:hypothetical protein
MSLFRWIAPIVVLLAMGAAAVAPASADKPEIIRESFTETFADEFLTEACGVPVTTTVTVRTIRREFDRSGTGPLEVFTINATLVARSGDNTFRFKDVGADMTRRTPSGAITLKIAGQVPFAFKGSQVVDEVTGAVLREARRRVSTDAACAALTA